MASYLASPALAPVALVLSVALAALCVGVCVCVSFRLAAWAVFCWTGLFWALAVCARLFLLAVFGLLSLAGWAPLRRRVMGGPQVPVELHGRHGLHAPARLEDSKKGGGKEKWEVVVEGGVGRGVEWRLGLESKDEQEDQDEAKRKTVGRGMGMGVGVIAAADGSVGSGDRLVVSSIPNPRSLQYFITSEL